MKRFRWILFLFLFVGCEDVTFEWDPPVKCPDGECKPTPEPVEVECPHRFRPPVDLPTFLHERNWGGGSCVHAALVFVLRWQHHFEFADWWRSNNIGGETFRGLCVDAERQDMTWGATNSGDVGFLEWASRTRRGAVIFYKSNHAIAFCGFVVKEDGLRYACVVDNNRPGINEWILYDQFVQRWKGYGGVAFTPIYTPEPPLPWVS